MIGQPSSPNQQNLISSVNSTTRLGKRVCFFSTSNIQKTEFYINIKNFFPAANWLKQVLFGLEKWGFFQFLKNTPTKNFMSIWRFCFYSLWLTGQSSRPLEVLGFFSTSKYTNKEFTSTSTFFFLSSNYEVHWRNMIIANCRILLINFAYRFFYQFFFVNFVYQDLFHFRPSVYNFGILGCTLS